MRNRKPGSRRYPKAYIPASANRPPSPRFPRSEFPNQKLRSMTNHRVGLSLQGVVVPKYSSLSAHRKGSQGMCFCAYPPSNYITLAKILYIPNTFHIHLMDHCWGGLCSRNKLGYRFNEDIIKGVTQSRNGSRCMRMVGRKGNWYG